MPLFSLFELPSRISRGQWWLGMAIIGAILSGALAMGGQHSLPVMACVAGISAIIFVLITIPRLHDCNVAFGTACYCVMAVGLVAKTFRNTLESDQRWWAVVAIGAGIAIGAIFQLGCLRGTVGDNPYGPDPLDDTAGIKRTA